mmetsp:Transcript_16276/g.35414  ORF Transcript_16276/g.35414 Transcript_16276/m.35414 type:complete len:99 (+) Transcript_16276:36-332(+)
MVAIDYNINGPPTAWRDKSTWRGPRYSLGHLKGGHLLDRGIAASVAARIRRRMNAPRGKIVPYRSRSFLGEDMPLEEERGNFEALFSQSKMKSRKYWH